MPATKTRPSTGENNSFEMIEWSRVMQFKAIAFFFESGAGGRQQRLDGAAAAAAAAAAFGARGKKLSETQ